MRRPDTSDLNSPAAGRAFAGHGSGLAPSVASDPDGLCPVPGPAP
jgi:hypothetical protein